MYPGTEIDLRGLVAPLDAMAQKDALYSGFSIMLWPYWLIDLPFSLAVDTICLPYDVYKVTIGGKDRSGRGKVSGWQP